MGQALLLDTCQTETRHLVADTLSRIGLIVPLLSRFTE